MIRDLPECGADGRELIMRLLNRLIELNRENGLSVGHDMTKTLSELGPTVRRYSFEMLD